MDRFIGKIMGVADPAIFGLKSNMDRFIVYRKVSIKVRLLEV